MQICLSPGRETENLFGVALRPDDGGTMVFCEQCQDWFHQDKCISQKLMMKFKKMLTGSVNNVDNNVLCYI